MTTSRRLPFTLPFVLLVALAGADPALPEDGAEEAFASITESELWVDLSFLASPALEGRDSPSKGLTRAAEHIAARLTAFGYRPPFEGDDASMLVPFERRLPAPDLEASVLASREHTDWQAGRDFVPVVGATGTATGEVVFVGFGIDANGERYDDIPGDMRGQIALVLEGEPRHRKKFEGEEVTPDADLYQKLAELGDAEAEAVLVVRRPPPTPEAPKSKSRGRSRRGDAPTADPSAEGLTAEFGFRHTWASWVGDPTAGRGRGRGRGGRGTSIPALEITPAVADALLGRDVLALAAEIDASAKAPKALETGTEVTLSSEVRITEVPIENVIGVLPGSDPELADEYVVLGAHMDHIGVDPRGRMGLGADDNASGVSALLEVAQALALAKPRRSVVVCAFGAEEDGLQGSRAFTTQWPVPQDAIVAMLNMDMIGRGDPNRVIILGAQENPTLEKLVKRANKLHPTKIRKLVTDEGQELFQRSDHYPFHLSDIPALFFFEDLPITDNEDYHTWRDTLDKLDVEKIARTARLVFNTAWLLCQDDERPPAPR